MKSYFSKFFVYSNDYVLTNNLSILFINQRNFIFSGSAGEASTKHMSDIVVIDNDTVDTHKIVATLKQNQKSSPKILVVSMEPETFYDVVSFGINGFLSNKNYKEILDALHAIAKNGYYTDLITTKLLFSKFKQNYFFDLTDRERDILHEMYKHSTYKQMATNLNISVSTVKNHVENIYVKLNVRNKYDALNKAKQLM